MLIQPCCYKNLILIKYIMNGGGVLGEGERERHPITSLVSMAMEKCYNIMSKVVPIGMRNNKVFSMGGWVAEELHVFRWALRGAKHSRREYKHHVVGHVVCPRYSQSKCVSCERWWGEIFVLERDKSLVVVRSNALKIVLLDIIEETK